MCRKKFLDVEKIESAVKRVGSVVAEPERWQQIWETNIVRSKRLDPSGLGKQRCVYNDRMAEFEMMLLVLDFSEIPNRVRFKLVV
ncbi:hypothetical protein DL762_002932 [Monosporascus cannonballus]|uniref:Transferrin receptor-like dimerisation domain-containing protein n=1 Tax=Monosporascus cannonballus TaxID=155416 RepID=A0ABY0HC27_9PEZI|nr:hypothetical protein DL762_002932 [Monosporascus cannonballus]RYO97270.1 hypothetical protein DL763_002819 [Monosporascus cannonballus]